MTVLSAPVAQDSLLRSRTTPSTYPVFLVVLLHAGSPFAAYAEAMLEDAAAAKQLTSTRDIDIRRALSEGREGDVQRSLRKALQPETTEHASSHAAGPSVFPFSFSGSVAMHHLHLRSTVASKVPDGRHALHSGTVNGSVHEFSKWQELSPGGLTTQLLAVTRQAAPVLQGPIWQSARQAQQPDTALCIYLAQPVVKPQ